MRVCSNPSNDNSPISPARKFQKSISACDGPQIIQYLHKFMICGKLPMTWTYTWMTVTRLFHCCTYKFHIKWNLDWLNIPCSHQQWVPPRFWYITCFNMSDIEWLYPRWAFKLSNHCYLAQKRSSSSWHAALSKEKQSICFCIWALVLFQSSRWPWWFLKNVQDKHMQMCINLQDIVLYCYDCDYNWSSCRASFPNFPCFFL